MATLLLTVVGTALGGPIGGLIGGLAGGAIDRALVFTPKTREGPRLSDLSVQTSSYGSPIARIYGTMRVAGSVIWSTDLIETRSTSSSGKGQPSVANYSYSASFAVLLSARPIQGIGRIWADGKLLRGAEGDFKSQTGFRLHAGDADQPVDPLIAAAEGVTLTPAHRDSAYAVFENFQLADYGNRIPSLTFEVIADPGPVAIGAVAADVSSGTVGGSDVTATLDGFSAYGDSLRDVLSVLATAGDAWFAPDGSRLRLCNGRAVSAVLDDSGYAGAGGKAAGARQVRQLAAVGTVARTLTVAHYDPARDYQTSIQRARRSGAGSRTTRIDLPAALSADRARTIAEAALAAAESGRERRTLAASWATIGTAPGDLVTIAGEPGIWRVEDWSLESMVLSLGLTRLATPMPAAIGASPGRVLSSPDLLIGRTILVAAELPPLEDMMLAVPRLLIAAAGTGSGWRQAALLLSTDGGAHYAGIGPTAAPAVIGTLAAPLGSADAALIDTINTIDVELLHADLALHAATNAALDAGTNLALVGDELIQFGAASQIGPARWRLSRLWRGRRGTEAAIGTQAAGDRFALLTAEALTSAAVPLAALGGTAQVMGSGVGDEDGPASATAPITGGSVRPPAPVHLTADRLADGGTALRWVRRSRLGWRWIDGVDAPLGEEQEQYRVSIINPDGTGSDQWTTGPAALLGALLPGTRIEVRQVGDCAESLPAALIITS